MNQNANLGAAIYAHRANALSSLYYDLYHDAVVAEMKAYETGLARDFELADDAADLACMAMQEANMACEEAEAYNVYMGEVLDAFYTTGKFIDAVAAVRDVVETSAYKISLVAKEINGVLDNKVVAYYNLPSNFRSTLGDTVPENPKVHRAFGNGPTAAVEEYISVTTNTSRLLATAVATIDDIVVEATTTIDSLVAVVGGDLVDDTILVTKAVAILSNIVTALANWILFKESTLLVIQTRDVSEAAAVKVKRATVEKKRQQADNKYKAALDAFNTANANSLDVETVAKYAATDAEDATVLFGVYADDIIAESLFSMQLLAVM